MMFAVATAGGRILLKQEMQGLKLERNCPGKPTQALWRLYGHSPKNMGDVLKESIPAKDLFLML